MYGGANSADMTLAVVVRRLAQLDTGTTFGTEFHAAS
jgi:hypothetical protein